jgi:hypothetical protein
METRSKRNGIAYSFVFSGFWGRKRKADRHFGDPKFAEVIPSEAELRAFADAAAAELGVKRGRAEVRVFPNAEENTYTMDDGRVAVTIVHPILSDRAPALSFEV